MRPFRLRKAMRQALAEDTNLLPSAKLAIRVAMLTPAGFQKVRDYCLPKMIGEGLLMADGVMTADTDQQEAIDWLAIIELIRDWLPAILSILSLFFGSEVEGDED